MAKIDSSFFKGEETNYEKKWFCLFLIDVSTSMSEEALLRVNEELHNLHKLVKEDITSSQYFEFCVMTFGQEVKTVQEPALVENFTMPKVVRKDGIIHALDCAVEKINARKCWYKITGQIFFRPCLFLVTNKADEKLLHCDELKHLKEEVQKQRFDLLMIGMNGSSVHAHHSNVEIRLKDSLSLAQLLYSAWNCVSFDPETPMTLSDDDYLTGIITFDI